MSKNDKLADKFLYSQQSLSTFEQCPMRFKKRHLENIRWDNVFDKEQKMAIERGMDFHLLARRYFLGISSDPGAQRTEDEMLELWLCNLKQAFRIEPEAVYLPEQTITIRMGKLRIQATLDLVISREDRLEIWDWKTHNSLTQTDITKTGKRLEKCLQTRVYLYMLCEYAARNRINPDKEKVFKRDINNEKTISMSYWQPDPPGVIVRIDYDNIAHEENRKFLENRISDIEGYNWEAFDKRLYSKHCKCCEFNWLCNGPTATASISSGEEYTEF